MTIFEFEEYKPFVNEWIRAHPKQGYGIYAKIAKHLSTNSVIISQIFKGTRDINLEQTSKLAEFMTLSTAETDYLLLLVQLARAGTHDLRKILLRQLKESRLRGQAVKNRIEHKQLTDEDKTFFYSSWNVIATWLAAPIAKFSSIKDLANHFQLPDEVVSDSIRFLLDRGLLSKNGRQYEFGKNVIHVPHDSPYVSKHHANWRLKALQSMDHRIDNNLYYTAPMSLSEKTANKLREELLQLIQDVTKKVAASESEKLICLNMDWFEF